MEDIRKDVDLDIVGHGTGTAFRHRVADLGKETCDGVLFPVREECVALDGGSSIGSDERYVVTPGTAEIEICFPAPGLFGGKYTVPDFLTGAVLRGGCSNRRYNERCCGHEKRN